MRYDPKSVRHTLCVGCEVKRVAQVFVNSDDGRPGWWFPAEPVMCASCNRRALREHLVGTPKPGRYSQPTVERKKKRAKKKDTGAAT